MIGPIKTVAVYVADQQRSKAFYTETLGFELRREMPMGADVHWIEVSPPGAETSLVIYPRSLMKDWVEKKPSIVFHCSDVERYCDELRRRGVNIAMEPSDMPWGKFAAFFDPDGNEFGMTSQELAR